MRTNTNAGTGGLFLSNAEFKGFNGQVLQDKCCGISQLYVSVNYRESKSLIADFTDSFYVAVPSPEPWWTTLICRYKYLAPTLLKRIIVPSIEYQYRSVAAWTNIQPRKGKPALTLWKRHQWIMDKWEKDTFCTSLSPTYAQKLRDEWCRCYPPLRVFIVSLLTPKALKSFPFSLLHKLCICMMPRLRVIW